MQLLRTSRSRLLLALVAVTSGAAVSSALLNIHFDAERKLTQEFVTLGPNVVISPQHVAGDDTAQPLLDEAVSEAITKNAGPEVESYAPYLYFVGNVQGKSVIVAGARSNSAATAAASDCRVGAKAGQVFGIAPASKIVVRYRNNQLECTAVIAAATGGPEDTQVAILLRDAQQLIQQAGKASLFRVRVKGSPQVVEQAVQRWSKALPALEVRPIRQIAQAEGQILGRIRGLIFATVALILLLTALCVLSAMTALAMEHRRDVGLMKALGGEMNRVLRLFICEIVTLGVAGGILGWAAGIALSSWIGWRVFDATITPRLDVLPLTVALMTAVALAGAFPLRLLSRVRPGVILRGE